MTREELMARMSNKEYTRWQALRIIEVEEANERQRVANQQARAQAALKG